MWNRKNSQQEIFTLDKFGEEITLQPIVSIVESVSDHGGVSVMV